MILGKHTAHGVERRKGFVACRRTMSLVYKTTAVLFALSLFLPIALVRSADGQAVSEQPSEGPTGLQLLIGQIHTMAVAEVKRVAIGDPNLVDVTIISPQQILLRAKQPGLTNLIVWDTLGQHDTVIQVMSPGALPESKVTRSTDEISAELEEIFDQLGFPPLEILPRGEKVFLFGAVEDDEQFTSLEKVLDEFEDRVVNLVRIRPSGKPDAKTQDTGGPLVSLLVKVVEINRKDLEKLGVKWSESIKLSEQAMSAASVQDTIFRIGQTVSRDSLSATITALVQANRARILAEPKLVTSDGKEASSFIGLEVPIVTATSFGTGTSTVSASIEYRQTGVLLRMTPHIVDYEPSPEHVGKITVVMEAEISGIDNSVGLNVPVGSQTAFVPGFTVRRANTQVTTNSGETIAIAGLLQAEDTNTLDQVPGLGNIPVLGRLFRAPSKESTQRELVITVTPELLISQRAMAKQPNQVMSQPQAQAASVSRVVSTTPTADPRLHYALEIQKRIAQAIRFPMQARTLQRAGTVKLRLQLFSDGSLGRTQVIESSGSYLFDEEALSASKLQAPYPPFPPQLTERELWLEVPVIFSP